MANVLNSYNLSDTPLSPWSPYKTSMKLILLLFFQMRYRESDCCVHGKPTVNDEAKA